MKKVIILGICILLALTGCTKKEETKPVDENTDESVQIFNDQVVDQAIIKDHNIAYYDNTSHISYTVSNENNFDINISKLNISYYEDGVLVYSASREIGTISSNSSYTDEIILDLNLTTCNNVVYEIEK